MTDTAPPSERTRVRRAAERARYDNETLYAILDEAYICHLAFSDERGTHCIPMVCWREGAYLYIHGSNGSRLMKLAAGGAQVCVTVTHLDGLVLARSAFHHSMNFRSAVIYGAFEVVDGQAKVDAFDVFLETIASGRSKEARPGDQNELAATTLLRIPLHEAATKIRTGGPKDHAEDMSRPIWAGVLPLTLQAQAPVPDGVQTEAPEYVRQWARRSVTL